MEVKLGVKVMKLVDSLIGREVTVGQGSECHLTFVRGILHTYTCNYKVGKILYYIRRLVTKHFPRFDISLTSPVLFIWRDQNNTIDFFLSFSSCPLEKFICSLRLVFLEAKSDCNNIISK